MVVACRRRLLKSWEQTPLAKLFTLEDEWSMLKLRAQVTRTREAIRKRGLLLHDAFLKFDYSRTGMLTLEEVPLAWTPPVHPSTRHPCTPAHRLASPCLSSPCLSSAPQHIARPPHHT